MAAGTESLLVRIDATTEQLRRELKRADDQVQRSSRKMDRSLDKVDRSFRGVNAAATKAAAALGAFGLALSGGALTQGIGRSLRSIQEIQRQALALGESTDSIQELNYAFREFGLQADDVSDALNTLADRSQDAIDGTKSMQEDFALLGITVDDLRGKNPGELFNLMAREVAKIEDPTARAAAVVRTFGDDLGRRLLPLLIRGEEGVRGLRNEAHELNGVLGEEAVKAGADAAREFNKVRAVFDAQFARAVADSSDEFTALAKTLSSPDFQEGVSWIVNRIRDLTENISGAVAGIGRLKQELASFSLAEAGETLGRGVLSRTGPGFLYEQITGQSLSDRLFGERDSLPAGNGSSGSRSGGTSQSSTPPPVITGNPPLPNVTAGYEPGSVTYDPAKELDRMAESGQAAKDVLEELESRGSKLNATMRGFGDVTSSAFEDAILQAQSLQDVLQGLLEDIARVILRTQVTGPLGDYIGGLNFGGGGDSSGVASNVPMFGGGRASGGPVQPGYFYEVNERGQEYFAPSVPGEIIPSGGAGGGAMAGAIPPPEVHIHTDAESRVERTETRRGADGRQEFHTWIVREVKEGMARGELDRDMQGNFGVTRRGAR